MGGSARLMRLLGVSERIPITDTTSTKHAHITARGGAAMSVADVKAMHEALTVGYAAIWWLESSGLLPPGYYGNITSRVDYTD